MADVDVWAVSFRDAIHFNNKVEKRLFRESQGHPVCVITRVPGGVRLTRLSGGRPVFVPDANINQVEMLDEVTTPAKAKVASV